MGVRVMLDSPFIDSYLLEAFRFRTRGFMRMEEAPDRMPPRPADVPASLWGTAYPGAAKP